MSENPGDPTTRETEELFRLKHTLGDARFHSIKRHVWEQHMRETAPSPTLPLYRGVWRAVLEALRAAVQH